MDWCVQGRRSAASHAVSMTKQRRGSRASQEPASDACVRAPAFMVTTPPMQPLRVAHTLPSHPPQMPATPQVLKAEVHDGSHDRWWEAQQQPPSSAPAVAAMDDAPAASGIGRRAAGGESAAGAAQVSSTDEQAEQEAANSARSRWLLANAGLEAQALLAGGAAPVTAFSPAAYVPDPKYANVTVNPADLSSPGVCAGGQDGQGMGRRGWGAAHTPRPPFACMPSSLLTHLAA